MKTKDVLIASLGIIISVFLLYITFRDIDFYKIGSLLKMTDYRFVALFLVSTFFEMFFRALKWYLILKINVEGIKFWDVFKFAIVGLGINNILPFRIGELTKMFLVSSFYSVSKTMVLSTVFVERTIDTIILFSLFLLYSEFGNINIIVDPAIILSILVVAVIVIFIFFIYADRILNFSYFKKLKISHPKLHSTLVKIKNGGRCFKNLKFTFLILFYGIVQWNFDVLNNYFMAKALDIDVIDYFKSAMTVFAGSISASIPSMPGYFGNYEYAISRVCMTWGVDKDVSIAFPTLIHIITYVVITVAAIVFIYSLGLNFKKIINISKGKK
ncbi:MAG: flippase-like domain-containing protein [Elusimicrobiales bacterium]|jgi:uncharacterized protein (TIRG00374 family)|nr:flippase-like domain-containing protein [Elusimicrobiales bacterium]NLH39627.1 flippase-like domain-containing protein [Elusimicrobiota bacterium]